jgi:hypothetical protein
MRLKDPRGDKFFISRESVIRCAEEVPQIEAIAMLDDAARQSVPERNIESVGPATAPIPLMPMPLIISGETAPAAPPETPASTPEPRLPVAVSARGR